MKKLASLVAVAAIVLGMDTPAFTAQEPGQQPPKYRLELVYIFESNEPEFIFVVGNSGFKTVYSLERFIAGLPPGSKLEWAPGCRRLGNEPLLSSEDDMSDFMRFCEAHAVKFILQPSG